MAIAEIKVVPVGTHNASFSSIVTDCYRIARETPGIRHQLTPTSTIIEGDLPQVLDVVQRMHDATLQNGCTRVVTSVSIDDRRDRPSSMDHMVEAVQDDLAGGAAPDPDQVMRPDRISRPERTFC